MRVYSRAGGARARGLPPRPTREGLEQAQFAGAGDGFGASLHLEFGEDSLVVPFDRTQGEEESLANFAIGEALGDELEYFQLACAQGFNEGLGWEQIGFVLGAGWAWLRLNFKWGKGSQQLGAIVGHDALGGGGGQ